MMIDDPWVWRPLREMPAGAEGWALPGQAEQEAAWTRCRESLKGDPAKERFMRGWLRERVRAFAIETGQIEGLYTLRRGVTEQLVAEGFAGVVGAHTFESVEDETIRGLLHDQEAAYDMMFEDVASGRPLSQSMIKSWHQLLTRHQATVTGLDIQGRRIAVPFRTKGRWKIRPNNPRRLDGNGRGSRLLMAWAYINRSLPPPVITAQGKPDYIDALERADAGSLQAFSDYIGALSLTSLMSAIALARDALAGKLNRANGNGGRTIGDTYHPPIAD